MDILSLELVASSKRRGKDGHDCYRNQNQRAREHAHLTQDDLSEIVDISPIHVSVIERGVKTPKLDTFVKIIKALNLSADVLLLDGVNQLNDSIVTELSMRIGRLLQKDQERVLNAIRALTE